MHHLLRQIGSDGSLKIPERWLAALRALRAAGAGTPVLELALAGWVNATRPDDAGRQVFGTTDPAAAALARCWRTRPTRGPGRAPCSAPSAPRTSPSSADLTASVAARLPALRPGRSRSDPAPPT